MPNTRRFLRWTIFIIIFVEALVFGAPWKQDITIEIIRTDRPVVDTAVRFVNWELGRSCNALGVEGRTDEGGVYTDWRWRWIGLLDLVTVFVQMDGLCIADSGQWRLVWLGHYGPAPKHLSLKCNLDLDSTRPTELETIFLGGICEKKSR
jgi:hypothetical protein